MGCAKSKSHTLNTSKVVHSTGRMTHKAELRSHYEVEGFKARVVLLYHVTSAEAAKAIVNSGGKMFRGSKGMFGGGIYFAVDFDIANYKAHYHGATIEADVVLGYSLVCRQAMHSMTYSELRKTYGCNSVKGDGPCLSNPEYVVYNWAQVSIKKVSIDGETYYEAKEEKESKVCSNSTCEYSGQKHIGSCRNKCMNLNCEFYGEHHLGTCSLRCKNESCVDYRESHRGGCKIRCLNERCMDYGNYHRGDCRNKCALMKGAKRMGNFTLGLAQTGTKIIVAKSWP